MPIDKTRFTKWTRSLSFGDGDDDLRSVELRHSGEEGLGELVRRWEPKASNFNVEALVRDMIEEVEQDARGRGDLNRYRFRAFFGDNADSTKIFSCFYNFPLMEEGSGEGGVSEPANAKGQLAQQMRLLNDVFRTSVGSQGVVLRTLTDQIEKMNDASDKKDAEIEKLRDENRILRTKDFHEKLVLRREAFWEAQKEKLVETFTPLLPTAFNALTAGVLGMKVLPGANTPIENEMAALFGSLDPTQFHGMMAALKPHQQAVAWRVGLHFKKQWDEQQARVKNRGGGDAPPVAPPGAEGNGKTAPKAPNATTGGEGAAGTTGGTTGGGAGTPPSNGGTNSGDKKPS